MCLKWWYFNCLLTAYSKLINYCFFDAFTLHWFRAAVLMQAKRFLIVWISLSTKPIALWSCIGASFNCMLFWLKCFNLLSRSASSLIQPNCTGYTVQQNIFLKKFQNIIRISSIKHFCCRKFWKSINTCKKANLLIFFIINCPPQTIWISSFRTLHNFNGAHFLAEIIDFIFLPILTQGLHFAVFVAIYAYMATTRELPYRSFAMFQDD